MTASNSATSATAQALQLGHLGDGLGSATRDDSEQLGHLGDGLGPVTHDATTIE